MGTVAGNRTARDRGTSRVWVVIGKESAICCLQEDTVKPSCFSLSVVVLVSGYDLGPRDVRGCLDWMGTYLPRWETPYETQKDRSSQLLD